MEKGRLWFTADTHFGKDSNDIIYREMRPFAGIAEYTAAQVRIWNEQAAPEDTIYVVGDFCNYNSFEKDYVSGLAVSRRVNAHLILITGNQEDRVIRDHFGGDFERFRAWCLGSDLFRFVDIRKNDYVELCGQKFFLTHAPVNHDPECLTLFGHTHRGSGLWKPYGFNVGTDLKHFMLFSEDDIRNLLGQKTWWDKDADMFCM